MELPKPLVTVTTLSKILEGILFVLLPFTGFYLGMKYQTSISPKANEDITNVATTPTKTPPSPNPTAEWKTYTNEKYGLESRYPHRLKLMLELTLFLNLLLMIQKSIINLNISMILKWKII